MVGRLVLSTDPQVNRMFEELADLMDLKKGELLAEVGGPETGWHGGRVVGWQGGGTASPQVRRRRDRKRAVLEEQQRSIREEQAAVATCLRAAQDQSKVDLED